MRYVIYGAGGIGGTVGALLHLSGSEVALIARGEHFESIVRRGLRFVAPDGEWQLPIDVYDHPASLSWRTDDVVILTVKSQQTRAALDDLHAVAPHVTVVCAQNGVANERIAAELFARVVSMLVVLPATHLEPGLVVTYNEGIRGVMDCGLYPDGTDAIVDTIAADMERAGFSCRADDCAMRWKYAKLLMNLGNAVEAMCDIGAAKPLLRQLREEALACYEAAGLLCASSEDFKKRMDVGMRMADVPEYPHQGGSTWQSVARGAGSIETDFLNGEIVALGEAHGVATPANAAVQRAMQEFVSRRCEPKSWTAERILSI